VIIGDDEINEIYLHLEKECTDLLALQQPVAGDLRFVTATFKILTDLERIADLATNLGRYTLQAERNRFPDVDIQMIGDTVVKMQADAMEAYASGNIEACREIARRDGVVDEMCEQATDSVVRDLLDTEREDTNSEPDMEALMQDVSRLLLTVRDLERVGDHAVNVAARSLYMVENDPSLLE
jgi:phosphate transport system protein